MWLLQQKHATEEKQPIYNLSSISFHPEESPSAVATTEAQLTVSQRDGGNCRIRHSLQTHQYAQSLQTLVSSSRHGVIHRQSYGRKVSAWASWVRQRERLVELSATSLVIPGTKNL